MHLLSQGAQTVRVGGRQFSFADGEKIITEFSYKHTPEGFVTLAESAGFRMSRFWTDPKRYFAVFHFVTRS